MNQRLQSAEAPDVAAPRASSLSQRPSQGWRTVKDLTAELRFPSEDACRTWLRRQGIANVRRGRVILVSAVDELEQGLELIS